MKIEPPVSPSIEIAAAVVKGVVSAIPVAGGVLSEVGNLILNPLERRKERWMVEVSGAINTLVEKYGLIPEQLANDEQFTTFLVQASFSALKTHQAIKLGALRNALVNSYNRTESEAEVGLQYLRYIDELSPTHLKLLSAIDLNVARYATFTTLDELHTALPVDAGISIERSNLRAFLQDLEASFLIRLGDLEELLEYASKKSMALREESDIGSVDVTPIGTGFLSFVRP